MLFGGNAAKTPVKFQSGRTILNINIAAWGRNIAIRHLQVLDIKMPPPPHPDDLNYDIDGTSRSYHLSMRTNFNQNVKQDIITRDANSLSRAIISLWCHWRLHHKIIVFDIIKFAMLISILQQINILLLQKWRNYCRLCAKLNCEPRDLELWTAIL